MGGKRGAGLAFRGDMTMPSTHIMSEDVEAKLAEARSWYASPLDMAQ